MSARHTIRRETPAGFELPSFNPEPWTQDALCAQVEPDVMFPNPSDRAGIARAKRVCAACPVQAECLAFASRSPREEHGVWGGKSFHKTRKARS